MLYIICHRGNANYNEIQVHIYQSGQIPQHWQDLMLVKKEEISFIAGGNAKWYSHFGRHIWKIEHILLQCSNVLSGICSKNLKIYVHTKSVCKHTATLVILVVTWMQPRCISVGEWVNCIIFTQWNFFFFFCIKQKWAIKAWNYMGEY